MAMSPTSACGWSFNLSGTEGFNTCYDYYDDEGLGYGLAYKMKLTLSPAHEDGKLPPPLPRLTANCPSKAAAGLVGLPTC